MEQTSQLIIPTLSRAKLSRKLSYPIGAKSISEALASAVQLPDLNLHFHPTFYIGIERGHYEFLRAEYLSKAHPAEKWPITSLYGRPPQGRWEIVVQSVPRVVRNRIKEYIVETALPQITRWLAKRVQLTQQGNDILAFFYDDKTEEFTPRKLTHLEPLRHRGK